MADTATPQIDSMESVPFPSEPESGMALQSSDSKPVNGAGAGEDGEAKEVKRKGPKDKPTKFKPKNGCQRCCGGIMSFFANDAIYGSFVGPHPVSFFCICHPCKKCISRSCARPLCVASIVTKAMNFIMLAVVTLLSCFFIFPWFHTSFTTNSTQMVSFYPCDGKSVVHKESNGGCEASAGYYMTYRVFLAFGFVMLTNCFAMADVTSTTDDPYRKRIHHGFWMYKYIYLFVLLLFFFTFLHGSHDKDGHFEFTMHILGNLAHVVFSFMELTVILDIVEIWVVSVALTNNSWADFLYTLVTCVIFIADIVGFISIITHFGFQLRFDILELKNKADRYDFLKEKAKFTLQDILGTTSKPIDTTSNIILQILKDRVPNGSFHGGWPHTNCLDGESGDIEWKHTGWIIVIAAVAGTLVVVMALKKRFSDRYPFQGWLQVAVIILFNVFYLWSALFNSPITDSRPRCNWALKLVADHPKRKHDYKPETAIQEGSQETYFRYTGFFHGMIAVFTLLYFAFVHGPRSKTAPLSLAYRYFVAGGYDRVPVYPDPEDSPPEFNLAVERLEVWDDEQEKVAQSWSLFYLMMLFGSFSLMMSMTNFTDPWATARYNSSDKALLFKIFTAIGVTLAYVCFMVCPCTRVYKAYEVPKRKRRLIKKVQEEETKVEDDQVVVEIYEEEQEGWSF